MDDGSIELSKILKDIDDVDLLREIILMLHSDRLDEKTKG
jgi:hypothetical protein